MVPRINIAVELKKEKEKDVLKELLEEALSIIKNENKKEENILERIQDAEIKVKKEINIASEDIFTIAQIKRIAITYRLRFLDSKLFKGEIPYESIVKVKQLEKKHHVKFSEFKILAPASLFKLEDRNRDPLLFAKISEDKYLFIHKWGNDLSGLRKVVALPLRSIKNFVLTLLCLSVLITIAIPADYSTRLFIFLLSNLFFASMFAHIGYMRLNQNFSEFEWDSKFIN
jgi:hypothetical protein